MINRLRHAKILSAFSWYSFCVILDRVSSTSWRMQMTRGLLWMSAHTRIGNMLCRCATVVANFCDSSQEKRSLFDSKTSVLLPKFDITSEYAHTCECQRTLTQSTYTICNMFTKAHIYRQFFRLVAIQRCSLISTYGLDLDWLDLSFYYRYYRIRLIFCGLLPTYLPSCKKKKCGSLSILYVNLNIHKL